MKTRTSAIAIVVAGVATMLAGASALGAPTTPISCGMIVTSSIKAGNDLNNCAGNGLLAGANGITIDLNRHTIDGSGAGDGVTTNGHTGVNVTNGFVQEFSNAVHVDGGSANAKVSQVTADSNGTGFRVENDGAKIQFSYADASGGVGFDIEAMKVKLTSVGARSNAGNGIFIDGDSNTVGSSTLAFNGGNGIDATGNSQVFTNNHIDSTTGNDGIVLSNGKSSKITGNWINNSAGNGVDVTGQGLTITGNWISDSLGNDGISVSGGTSR